MSDCERDILLVYKSGRQKKIKSLSYEVIHDFLKVYEGTDSWTFYSLRDVVGFWVDGRRSNRERHNMGDFIR